MSTIASMLKRVERIEARQPTGHIAKLVNLGGFPPEVVADAVTNWRRWVADGRANRDGDTLIIHAPLLTVEEWITETDKYQIERLQ
ncbi:hypothetical protein [Methylobacterium durans]|uniref:Uncharacterized protein n=1 Tax=Methylobacterium durans TaxID=2202825 RepID=A0A2U8W1L8_9HYPH|nr:hypothetical protein [Methylobacterium durans]AWN39955.1 hypothetical protein DK389_04620 [Methylobacterium durans]